MCCPVMFSFSTLHFKLNEQTKSYYLFSHNKKEEMPPPHKKIIINKFLMHTRVRTKLAVNLRLD